MSETKVQPYTNRRYLDAIQDRVLIFDGAMGTSLQKMDLGVAEFGGEKTLGCIDYLVISYPQAVETVHRSFLEVGADVIETDTFRANRFTLSEYGLGDHVLELNEAAAKLARRIADEYSTPGQPRFIAGSMGPSGKLPSVDDPEMSNVTFAELSAVYREQATGLIRGGVDLLLIETSQDILEVKASILGVQGAFADTGQRVPLQVQVTLDTTGRMLLGTDPAAVLVILEGLPIDVIGLNCSTGPEHMREPIHYLGEHASLPVSCIPNAGLPLNIDGQAVYPLEPEPFVNDLLEFVEKNHISVVGGCCGTTPAHISLLVEKLHGRKHPPRPEIQAPMLSSNTLATAMLQEPRPFLIGERLNTQGSRNFKKIILAEDYDSVLTLARQQVDGGAHGLDICVALTERGDEALTMRKVVKVLASSVRAPLVIDTTEPDVMETALETTAGRSLLNSTHLEGGPDKARKIFALAKKYNAAVICLTIDEQGMAKTADRKLEVARRLVDLAVSEFQLKPQDLVFDALTFTLATGDPEFATSAVETLEGIRRIKTELPGVLTSLGVSNVSFGLAPGLRAVLNSVMLYHAVQNGLDMAIVNPAHVTPYAEIPAEERELAEDLIFNRRPDALPRFIEHFDQPDAVAKTETRRNPLEGMTAEQRVHWRILHRHKEEIENDLSEILDRVSPEKRSDQAVMIINTVLLPAMKEVGDKFGAGELILPFVLQSAEVMKKAVSYVEQFLEKKEGASRGTLVLATVYGDVHDIGKNLVKTILSNNGYKVIDLGKQVPAEKIITQAVEANATAIGLSALLVSTSKQMPLIVNELDRRGLKFPILIGGAAINQRFGRRILLTEQGRYYEPGVFYCKDAFEGLATMESLTTPGKKEDLLARTRKEADFELRRASQAEEFTPARIRSEVPPAKRIPVPPVWGPRVVHSMPLESVFECLPKNELFRLSWGAKNTHGDAWERLKAEYEQRLREMEKQAIQEGWLKPQAVYGYWPVQSEMDDLVFYDPNSVEQGSPAEIQRFSFPRQPDGDHLSLADYFASTDSGIMDVVALQVVTVGEEATRRFQRLQDTNQYTEAYYTHGLGVQTAEAAAEYLQRHIRRELGLLPGQCKRYSWGYPAIPELNDHEKVFALLPAESEIGVSLTAAYQLVPEQSTAAIVVHHPDAKYYNVGESRVEQLMR
ncbi:MAG TPA: methionine synthase [Anaerolineaceae bacterium]|nr:methionine synthase [Anaerolineaceae bacterium]